MQIRIFKYIEQLDCFIVDAQYRRIADEIGLSEWNAVVWIGRLFSLDNDYGEHWFDNWDLRDKIADKAESLNIDYDDLLIIDPDRFKDGKDGPCHTRDQRARFWKDVLTSLQLSIETIFEEARHFNDMRRIQGDKDFIDDLETRMQTIINKLGV